MVYTTAKQGKQKGRKRIMEDALTSELTHIEFAKFGVEIFTDDGVEGAGSPSLLLDGQPNPTMVRGRCPECGDVLASNWYYTEKRGYVCFWECVGAQSENPQCTYRRVK